MARLLSINVGRPREVEWEGKTVRTAIWKERVEGPRMVRRINIDGDDQADRLAHGGEHRAVFVYQIDSYRYWERELGRDDFTPGQFGENFTVEGLADDEVCIGDRYRIGQALFEVTQPRVTCYRVGIRMDEPAMPSLLVAHHRPGFYLRVLEEGPVEAGEEIVKVADGPERLTVAQVDALLYLPDKPRALLERALRVPALSEGWQGSFRELLAKGDRAAPAWSGFRSLRVAGIRRESAGISSFLLVPADDDAATPAAAPGQYLTLRVRPDDGAPALTRSYSLSTVPDDHGYRISVKREGAASRYLHDRVKVGDVLDVAAPRGDFVLRDGARPGRAHQRRRRRHAGPRDAPRARDRAERARGVVAPRRAQPRRARLRGRGRRAARHAARRPPRRRLQPAGRWRRQRPLRPARRRGARPAGRPDGRRPLHLRARGLHAGDRRRARRPGRGARADRHRGLRRRPHLQLRHRQGRRPGAARPGRSRRATGRS